MLFAAGTLLLAGLLLLLLVALLLFMRNRTGEGLLLLLLIKWSGELGAVVEWKILEPVLKGEAKTSALLFPPVRLLSIGITAEVEADTPTDEGLENKLFPEAVAAKERP